MKKFVIYIALSLFSYLILLESTTRFFNLSGHSVPEINLNNNRLGRPNAEGIWVKGGMREVYGHYKINSQGFNSIKNYSDIDTNKISIAIIGDSFVEGFHVDVENSIGRILEAETHNSVIVHEYGYSGGNIVDFSLVFDEYVKNKYNYTFVLVTNEDITSSEARFIGKGNLIVQKSVVREIYNRVSFIRYLNINQGLGAKLNKIFSFPKDSEGKEDKSLASDVNIFALKKFDNTCVMLYEKEKLDTNFIKKNIKLPCIEITKQYTPDNFGFDAHWNLNGRKNCALTIKNFIDEAK